jgi:hypothetical protein
MDPQSVGRVLLIVGVIVAVIGGLLWAFGNSGLIRAIGNLPGDIHIEGQGFTCLVPVVSSILISVVLTIVLNLIIRFLNRP